MGRARNARNPRLGEKLSCARQTYARVGPRKVRFVADAIRGLSVPEAQSALKIIHRPSAVPLLEKVLNSAVANAQHKAQLRNESVNPEDMIVGVIMVDSGPILDRWRPRAMGRATPIRKRTSHLTIEIFAQAS